MLPVCSSHKAFLNSIFDIIKIFYIESYILKYFICYNFVTLIIL